MRADSGHEQKEGGSALGSYSDSAVGRKGGEILEPRRPTKAVSVSYHSEHIFDHDEDRLGIAA
jgi:hypothetical protein